MLRAETAQRLFLPGQVGQDHAGGSFRILGLFLRAGIERDNRLPILIGAGRRQGKRLTGPKRQKHRQPREKSIFHFLFSLHPVKMFL